MFAFAFVICNAAVILSNNTSPADDIKKIVQERLQISDYVINTSSVLTSKTKTGQVVSRHEVYASKSGEKYFQDTKSESSKPNQSNHFTHCRGCFEDTRYTLKYRTVDSPTIYLASEKDLPMPLTNLLGIGLSFRNLTVIDKGFDKLLSQPDLYNEWIVDSSSSELPVYTATMKQGSFVKRIVLDRDKSKILIYEAFDPANKNVGYKIDNTYGKFGNFPIKCTYTEKTDTDEAIEVIEIKDFQRTSRLDDFTPAKAGLRYNINVSIQSKQPQATRYWDGQKLVMVCPDPSEYIKDYKAPDAKPPVQVPVAEAGFPWRWLLILFAVVLTVVSLIFAIRGVRSRR
jgi:hypothetical protein